MTPSDTTIVYKVSLFLHLYSDFWYNSLDSTCTCHYLLVGINMSQSPSPSKLNFQFIGGPTMLYWEGHYSSIRSAIEVNEHLMDLTRFQIDLVLPQYHVGKASKSSRHTVVVFAGSYIVVMGLLFILGTLTQVGAAPRRWRTHQGSP